MRQARLTSGTFTTVSLVCLNLNSCRTTAPASQFRVFAWTSFVRIWKQPATRRGPSFSFTTLWDSEGEIITSSPAGLQCITCLKKWKTVSAIRIPRREQGKMFSMDCPINALQRYGAQLYAFLERFWSVYYQGGFNTLSPKRCGLLARWPNGDLSTQLRPKTRPYLQDRHPSSDCSFCNIAKEYKRELRLHQRPLTPAVPSAHA